LDPLWNWLAGGVTPEEIGRVRPQLVEFAGRMFAGVLPREDQRDKGQLYLRGLLLDGARKSMQPMAARLGVDHQGLQQFITSSTWDVEAVRANLAGWGAAVLAPDAYVIDDTGFPKDGKASPLVARMYSGTLGKTGNCQIGVSVQMVTDVASLAVNWRLFCPASWDDTTVVDPVSAAAIRDRRDRAGVGPAVRHREKWRLAVDMLDQMADAWGLARLPVAADAGYGDATGFRLGLEERGYGYVVAVKATTSAHRGDAQPTTLAHRGPGRPSRPRYRDAPSNLHDLAIAAGTDASVTVTWRHGTRPSPANPTAAMTSQFLAITVRPANRDIPRHPDGTLPTRWLLVEWPDAAAEPTDYWLSNLPDDTSLTELVRLAKIRWRIEHDYRELKTGLGLDHFEGRTLTGWHRHVTLVCLAQAFATMLRLDPKAPAPA
jgi:SRSO17 transposase